MKKKNVIIILIISYFLFIISSLFFLNITPNFSFSNLDYVNDRYVILAVVTEICIILLPLIMIIAKVLFDECSEKTSDKT